MNSITAILAYIFFPSILLGQNKQFVINNVQFVIKPIKKKNEWNTHDKVNNLYRIENKKLNYLLTYYGYKDGGGDCNNSFWHEETLEVKNDSLIFLTHYYQHTGLDPIPEWRKQIYKVNGKGRLNLIYDKEKYYRQKKWVHTGSETAAAN